MSGSVQRYWVRQLSVSVISVIKCLMMTCVITWKGLPMGGYTDIESEILLILWPPKSMLRKEGIIFTAFHICHSMVHAVLADMVRYKGPKTHSLLPSNWNSARLKNHSNFSSRSVEKSVSYDHWKVTLGTMSIKPCRILGTKDYPNS